MRPWTFPIAFLEATEASRLPRFQRIAQAIREDIQRGRLKPGDTLPGSRTLAATLGVHRNTVLAAFRELEAEGWTSATYRSTRVAHDLPESPRGPRQGTPHLGFDLPAAPPRAGIVPSRALPPPEAVVFGGGIPDLRLVPRDLLARAYRRALRDTSLLGYGHATGEPRLRSALSRMLSEHRGLALGPESVVVAPGSQGALDQVARLLLRPGDRVAVENPGYTQAWATLQETGATLVPLPVDGGGLRLDALEATLEAGPLRAVYLTPHHQYPTTVTMTAPRRLRLLDLAARHRFAILEDDYDAEFHYEGRPVLPLASQDRQGTVIYLGTLSKILAPSLRLGFVTGPADLVEALGALRNATQSQGDPVLQRAAAELLEDGLLQRHARKMRRTYLARRDALADALTRHLGSVLAFQVPAGGMCLWAAVDPEVDVETWAQRAIAHGTGFQTGQRFDFHRRPQPFLRLGFSSLTEAELTLAVQRMAKALRG